MSLVFFSCAASVVEHPRCAELSWPQEIRKYLQEATVTKTLSELRCSWSSSQSTAIPRKKATMEEEEEEEGVREKSSLSPPLRILILAEPRQGAKDPDRQHRPWLGMGSVGGGATVIWDPWWCVSDASCARITASTCGGNLE
jgi:hypothetical protein